MGNILTYAQTVLDTFDQMEFHTVDSLILSWLSYYAWPGETRAIYTWEGVPIRELYRAEYFEQMFDTLWEKERSRDLLAAVAANPRFRDIRVKGYTCSTDVQQEKQFSAVTFELGEALSYVAFRGTDSTFVGWKEDLNMAFQCPIPSQKAAAEYLQRAGKMAKGRLIVGGHSKGGNLAIYSAAHNLALRERIVRVYSHDGPGFMAHVLEQENFKKISSKIEKTVPEASIVGMLLEQKEDFQVVKSDERSFYQHNPFTWVVEGRSLVCLSEMSREAMYLDESLNEWIQSISQEDRERLVNAIYALSDSLDADSFVQFSNDWKKNLPKLIASVTNMEQGTKEFLARSFRELALAPVRKAANTISARIENSDIRGES